MREWYPDFQLIGFGGKRIPKCEPTSSLKLEKEILLFASKSYDWV